MYNLIAASEFVLPVLFSFAIHMLGSYFLMNLMLAVIMDNYIQSEQAYNQELKALEEIERKKLYDKMN